MSPPASPPQLPLAGSREDCERSRGMLDSDDYQYVELGWSEGIRTDRTPDMDEMSSPKSPPPIHANEPTMYFTKSCLSYVATVHFQRTYWIGCNACVILKDKITNQVKCVRKTELTPLVILAKGGRGREGGGESMFLYVGSTTDRGGYGIGRADGEKTGKP